MESFGEDLETLRRVPLAEGHVARMRAIGSERAYSAGETVLKVGQPLDRFIYIIEGEIEPVDSFSGQRLFNAVLGPTQFIGDIGFLSGAAVTTGLAGSFVLQVQSTTAAFPAGFLSLDVATPNLGEEREVR